MFPFQNGPRGKQYLGMRPKEDQNLAGQTLHPATPFQWWQDMVLQGLGKIFIFYKIREQEGRTFSAGGERVGTGGRG
jgi:hypothetical protein